MGNHSKCFKCGELDEFCVCRPAPVTQQAAKAETASKNRDTVDLVTAVMDQFGFLDGVNEHRTEELCQALEAALNHLAPTTSTVSAPTEQIAAKLEAIAQSWDECICEGIGEDRDIGAVLREQFANIAAPISTVSAPDALKAEAAKLAPILRGMCEGGGEERDKDIYADDYPPGDGDVFVTRAADLLDEIATLRTVSASGSADEIRNAVLEEAAGVCDAAYKERGGVAFLYAAQEIRSLKRTSTAAQAAIAASAAEQK